MTDLPAIPPVTLTEDVQNALRRSWRRLRRGDTDAITRATVELGCNFPPPELGFEEDDAFFYLPVTVLSREGDTVREEVVLFALGDGVLVTLEPPEGFRPFDRALTIFRRRPEVTQSAYGIMYALLQVTNSAAHQLVELASSSLEVMGERIRDIVAGQDAQGRGIQTDSITEALGDLGESEDLISRIQEEQLLMERAARYLRLEIGGADPDLRAQVEALIDDIRSVKEHAGFEHDEVRYLQQSVMTSLNATQNQVVKVFTIITAVFLPPTLVATFYGMNFAVMPELSWEWGFTVTILLTLVFALLPLWYIKHRGWLR